MSGPTFRQYLDDRIADLIKDDFDLDSDDLSRQFVEWHQPLRIRPR